MSQEKTKSVCSIHPYFSVSSDRLDTFKGMCELFIERTKSESGCINYDFTIHEEANGSYIAHCRESYYDAACVLSHLENVGDILRDATEIADIIRLEFHGPESEIEKLREPLAHLNPDFYVTI